MLGFLKKHTTPNKKSVQDFLPNDVVFKRNPRARKIILRRKEISQSFTLTAPSYASRKAILSFMEKNLFWLEEQRKKIKKRRSFQADMTFPLCGKEIKIIHLSSNPRGKTNLAGAVLEVHGDENLINKRVVRFLKEYAFVVFKERLDFYSEKSGLSYRKLQIKELQTRWGSCSSAGEIVLSWRLLLAPPFVMDYVIAHEVSHLRYMDHSSQFWSFCENLAPDTKKAKKWLSNHGVDLHLYA